MTLPSDRYVADVWLNQRWLQHLHAAVPEKLQKKLAAMKDREKAAAKLREALAEQNQAMKSSDRDALVAKITEEMPRRLRRAMGDRGHKYGLGERSQTIKSRRRAI